MVVYYRGPTALITERILEVWCPDRQRFAVADLYDVHVVRGGADPLAVRAARIAAAAAVLVASLWPLLRAPAAFAVAGSVVSASGGVAVVCWRLARPDLELRATYRGYQVQLFRTRDAQQFGQVRRALVRALEAQVADNR